jgi:glycerol-3-phosphate dehydrogenase
VRSANGGRTADLSRRHRVTTGPGGVVAVTGGKLTTYRQMAEDTVDTVVGQLGRRARCRTARLPLLGAEEFEDAEPGTTAAHLGDRYGSSAPAIERLAAQDERLAEPLVPGLPYLRAEAVYAARHEMATTLDDVLVRRSRAHLLDRAATLAAAPDTADLLAGELGWNAATRQRQLADYRALVAQEVVDAAGEPG